MRTAAVRRSPHLIAILLLFAGTTCAFAAAPNAPGVNLRWDKCYGDGGTWNKMFACDTNVGMERLVLSFELAAPIEDVYSVQFHVALASASPALPAWWSLSRFDGCRPTALSFGASLPPGSVNCTDWAAGQFGDVYPDPNYAVPPNSMLFFGGEAAQVGNLRDLVPGVEYFIASIGIARSKTVGTGACAGCATPVCLLFGNLQLNTVPSSNRVILTQGANYSGSAVAYWQNGYITASDPAVYDASGYHPAVITGCVPYSTTSARTSTWGGVKSLYR